MFPKALPLHPSPQSLISLPYLNYHLFIADNSKSVSLAHDLFTEHEMSFCLPSKVFYLMLLSQLKLNKIITFSSNLASSNFSFSTHGSSSLICFPYQCLNFIHLCMHLFCHLFSLSNLSLILSVLPSRVLTSIPFFSFPQLPCPLGFHH